MNILIITQSGESGLNYQIALECKYMIYESGNSTIDSVKIENADTVDPAEIKNFSHIIMIVPEWNGSFPHTFKSLIDNSGYPSIFKKRRILLIGTSASDFGNIMGISHLQHILEWIGANVDSKRVCISRISELIDSDHGFRDIDDRLYKAINKFIKR
jgi:hypothetical protein